MSNLGLSSLGEESDFGVLRLASVNLRTSVGILGAALKRSSVSQM